MITIIGLPPAGGWVTFNIIIIKTPSPTAMGIKMYSGKGINVKAITPTVAVTRWPKKIFLGSAKGLSG